MYSLLNVSSTGRAASASVASEDLTTRARIRDAAIRRFGSVGFTASVRSIAEEAGVSPGLVIHHFGSKDGLRAACDAHVLATIAESKDSAVVGGNPTDVLQQLANVEQYAPVAVYTVQALLAGGRLANAFLDQMIADAESYLGAATAIGTVRPSRDPARRARFLVLANVGILLLHVRLHPPADGDFARTLRELSDQITLPALELYAEGLFTDRSMLDAYLMYVPDPPVGETGPGADRA